MAMVFTGPLFAATGEKASELLALIAKNRTEVSVNSNCFINDPSRTGCDDAVCEATVCAADSFCCDVGWDGICVTAAFAMCEIDETDSSVATFELNIQFDDNNEWDTTIAHISCTGGLPLANESRPIGDGSTNTFVLQFPEEGAGDTECHIWVEDVSGYTASYIASGPSGTDEDDNGCYYFNGQQQNGGIDEGDRFHCDVRLLPDDSYLRVTKKWNTVNAGGDRTNYHAQIAVCVGTDGVLAGGKEVTFTSDFCVMGEVWGPDDDYLDVTFTGANHGGDDVYIYERILDSSIEIDITNCVDNPYLVGNNSLVGGYSYKLFNGDGDGDGTGSNNCTITNTIFFEGIPTLNQYGLAIMVLLMMGVGLVRFRRFV